MFSLPIRVNPLQGMTRFIKQSRHTARSASQLAAPRDGQLMMEGNTVRTFAKNKSPQGELLPSQRRKISHS